MGKTTDRLLFGGSSLFMEPILALKTASRIVDMVPSPEVTRKSRITLSELSSFIWAPFGDIEQYIEKSDVFNRSRVHVLSLKDPHIREVDCDSLSFNPQRFKGITFKFCQKVRSMEEVCNNRPWWIPKCHLTPNKRICTII
jgi:hypothetical protein